MRALLTIVFVLIPMLINAQKPELKGANGFNFGMSRDEAKTLINSKGWHIYTKSTDKNDIKIIEKVNIGGISVDYITFKFFEGKLYEFTYLIPSSNQSETIRNLLTKYGTKNLERDTSSKNTLIYNWEFEKDRSLFFTIDFSNESCSLSYSDNLVAVKAKNKKEKTSADAF